MATLDHDRVNRAWQTSSLQQQDGLRIFDRNPQELGHMTFGNDRVPSSIRNMDSAMYDLTGQRPQSSSSRISTSDLNLDEHGIPQSIRDMDKALADFDTESVDSLPVPPRRTDSLEKPQAYSAIGPGAIAQISQDIGKGMASTLASEKNAYNTQKYLDALGAPGTHADMHAHMAKQMDDTNNNRSNAYAHVGAMFGPLGMLIGQLGAQLTEKKVDYDSDMFKTSRTFSGNFNPQAFTSVNAATSINQNNESHIQSST